MFQGFYELIYQQLFGNGANHLNDIYYLIGNSETTIYADEYMALLIALICTIIVYALCCLCVYKVIRLFGRLWSRF